jgi:alpha-tubulin suppressor-like RCC1 family protein
MNISELTKALHIKIATTTSLEEILMFSKCLESLKLGNVSTVATYTDLLSVYAKKGELYFVDDEDKLYYGFGTFWFSILDTAYIDYQTWGNNDSGQLGDNTIATKSSPVSVVSGFTDWIQVSAGGSHSLGVRANGTAWAWGNNLSGQLGDRTTTARSSSVSVVGGFTDWIQVSAGDRHSLGLRANGTAWAWGINNAGRLGDNTDTDRSSPVSVVGGFTDWIQVSAGSDHSLGLRVNGTAWAWGNNTNGRLGDNTIADRSSPVSVAGGFTDWIQVSAGEFHSLGLRANGTAWAWGLNTNGRLGDNTATARSSPVSVVGGFTDWIQVSAGGSHSLGLRANGTAWAWGNNTGGRLGDNTDTDRSSPVSVVGGFTDWIQVSASDRHSLGLRANGSAWAWGNNTSGQLGDNTAAGKSSPVSVVGGFTDWIQVSAGGSHSLGIRSQ